MVGRPHGEPCPTKQENKNLPLKDGIFGLTLSPFLPPAPALPGTRIRFTRATPLAVDGGVGRGGVCLCVGPSLSPLSPSRRQ